jgi:hypothetical protein
MSTATISHPIPLTLVEWLTGWTVSPQGNPWKAIGADRYVVYRGTGGEWRARIGPTALSEVWDDVSAGQRGLFAILRQASPATLASMHDGTYSKQRKQTVIRTDPPATSPRSDPDGAPLTVKTFSPESTEHRLELRLFEGEHFMTWAAYALTPNGPRLKQLIAVRSEDAAALASAILQQTGGPHL